MNSNNITTLYASAERCDYDALLKQMNYLSTLPLLKQGLDATHSMILILNTCRQTVFANKEYLHRMKAKGVSEVFGKRPGEIVNCIHACEGINGCGTARACRYCNAVNIILKAIEINENLSGECSNINRLHGYEKNINFSLHVAPLQVDQEMFYVVTFTDDSDSVQKKMLERIFFHDIINTAGALKGIVGLLKDDVPKIIKPEIEFVERAFEHLVEEIQAQQYIINAENNQLVLELTAVDSLEVLETISNLYRGIAVTVNKTIKLDDYCINKRFYIDLRLLRRILGNMIKNALEASEEWGVITLGCSMDGEKDEFIKFWVHSNSYMDEKVQSLVFHRSFSTKGTGRGLGTYSMKLFGEKFLKGKIGFSSSEENGTTFYVRLPLQQIVSE